jgi:tetratricopeptide (TPR) repeat protein
MKCFRMLIAAVGAACSAPAPLPDLVAAERLERQGDVGGALAAYRAAQHTCRNVTPARRRREVCARALIGEAEVLENAGRIEDAIAAWSTIPERSDGDPPPSAQGIYRAGVLSLQLGRDEVAWTYLWRVVTDYPDEAFAGDAVGVLLRDGRRRDPHALWQVMSDLVPALDHTRVADNLLWALADLAEHDLLDPARARALYDRIPIEHPDSGLRDDARWHGARLSRQLGDGEGAAARLRGLLATREVAFGAGSYFSVWLDDAQLELGIVLRDDLGRHDDAVRALRQLAKDYPHSILHDDASWEIAVTRARQGLRDDACKELAHLAATWPDSKYQLERAPALAVELGCPP